MNSQRRNVLLVAVAGMAATFMPWLSAPIVGSVPGSKGDGWITFALFLVGLICSLLGDKTKPLLGGGRTGSVITAGLAGLIGIWKIVDINTMDAGDFPDPGNPFAEVLARAMVQSFSIEYGLYLVVLAGIALPIAAYMEGLVQDPVLMGDDLDDEGWEDVSQEDGGWEDVSESVDEPPNSSASSDL